MHYAYCITTIKQTMLNRDRVVIILFGSVFMGMSPDVDEYYP